MVVAIAATAVTYQFFSRLLAYSCPGQNSIPPIMVDFNQCTPFLKLQGRQRNHYLLPYTRQCSRCVVSVSIGWSEGVHKSVWCSQRHQAGCLTDLLNVAWSCLHWQPTESDGVE